MRAPVAVLLVLLLPLLPVASAAGERATLTIDVAADRSESLVLEMTGLDERTQYNGICLPLNATVTRVRDAQGDLEHESVRDGARTTLTFRPVNGEAIVEMTRPATVEGVPPFHTSSANFCTTQDAAVAFVVRVEPPLSLFFASSGGEIAGREARWSGQGPDHVTYGYEAPPPAGVRVVEVAPFRMAVTPGQEDAARELAGIAAPALRRAIQQAGLEMPFATLPTVFSERPEFSWEAGHYGSDGILSIKPGHLDPDPREGYPYVGAKVLVHEGFHAASAPFGKGEVDDVIAWWLEGTARFAERQVDRELPGARRHCEEDARSVRCWFFDDRIPPASLETAYAPGFAFERRWEASLPQSDDTRRFYYAYSEFLVSTLVQRIGEPGYRAAWDDVQAAFAGEGCPCGDAWLEGRLVASASNLTKEELYRPYAALHASDPRAFDAKVAAFVQAPQEVPRGSGLFGLPVPGLEVALILLVMVVLALARRNRG